MTSGELTQLRRVYGEVCKGFSTIRWKDTDVFVKHLTCFDQTELDCFYERVLAGLIKRGMMTEADKFKLLEKQGLWTKGDEHEMANHKVYTDNLEKTKSLLPIKSQRDEIDVQLKEAQIKMFEMINRRSRHLGRTAERTAEMKAQYEYLRLAFFSDQAFTQPVFTAKDMDELTEEDSEALLNLYISIIQQFSLPQLRKIAVQLFFTNYYYLCGEDPTLFFQKPVVSLTTQQVNLLSFGHYFRSILSNHEVPKDISQDPDKIEEFVSQSTAAKKMMADTPAQGHRVGYIGAREEDFKAMGVQDGTNEMRKVASKQYQTGRDAAKDMGVNWTN